jgi:virginiamycin A acetyltransferase
MEANDLLPNPNVVFPVPNINTVTYVKPTIKNKNIIVGDGVIIGTESLEYVKEQLKEILMRE